MNIYISFPKKETKPLRPASGVGGVALKSKISLLFMANQPTPPPPPRPNRALLKPY